MTNSTLSIPTSHRKSIHIFRPGQHLDSAGELISFSEADVEKIVGAYDPKIHESPIVLGHPKTDAPAYGWVKGLKNEAGNVMAEVDHLDPSFSEWVTARRYNKVSASFYRPHSPRNPKPGSYYLRHVGFLGAEPPAIKGLQPISFAEGDSTDFVEIVEFSEQNVEQQLPANTPDPALSQLQQENAALKAQIAQQEQKQIQIAQESSHQANVAFAEKLIDEARLPSGSKNMMVALLDNLSTPGEPLTFSENGQSQALLDSFKAHLQTQIPMVSFNEVAIKTAHEHSLCTEFAESEPHQLALHHKAMSLSQGENISYEAAVSKILGGVQ